MALNKNKDLKQFYSIGEVSEMFGVKDTTLRFWEKEFDTINPEKAGRVRRYTKSDIEQIRLVHSLVKIRGLKISAAREALRSNKDGTVQVADVVDRLKAIRAQLVEIRNGLGVVE